MGVADSVLLNIQVYRILVESGMFNIQHIPYCKANCLLCLLWKIGSLQQLADKVAICH